MSNSKPIIYLGTDHGGYHLKEKIKLWLRAWGYHYEDLGNEVNDPTDDYPLYALSVAKRVSLDRQSGRSSLGIIGCRTAAGMVIVANKINGVRAVAGFDLNSVVHSRRENDANILALAGDIVSDANAKKLVKAWLETKFGGRTRHARRVKQIERLERGEFEIIPGILESDLKSISDKVKRVEKYFEWIQVDVTDGKLVNNSNFSDPVEFKKINSQAKFELHLMVSEPDQYVKPWATAGVKRIISQIEAGRVDQFIYACRQAKIETGLAIDLGTSVSKLKPYLKKIDCVLVMGVRAGYSGQKFAIIALEKIAQLRALMPKLPIEVDGGVSDQTAAALIAAGATRLVTTSFLFKHKNISDGISSLKKLN
ncbi:MAG: RpiB/LacA/LacB family sugar-phosphate isomerase [Patescibacteria group bacterium]|nr:RpiB/LacA/LacB family sugar-phosphate isomerase [Patescibacteria group bacterium]